MENLDSSTVTENKPTDIQETVPENKSKFSKAYIFVVALLLLFTGIGIVLGKLLFSQLTKPTVDISPLPTSSQVKVISPTQAINPSANLKTYINSFHKISFEYPSSWNLVENEGQMDNGNIYNTKIELSKKDALITIYLNVDGIGGRERTYKGKAFILDGHNLFQFNDTNSNNNTKLVGISNSLTTLGVFKINNITYSITINYPANYSQLEEDDLLKEFDRILYTFKFSNSPTPSNIKKIGYIKSITPNRDNYVIEVDYIDFIQDNNAPNGYRIDNPNTETARLSTDVSGSEPKVIMQTYSHTPDGNFNFNQSITFSEFINSFNTGSAIKNVPYWIETQNGTVVKITEQYIP